MATLFANILSQFVDTIYRGIICLIITFWMILLQVQLHLISHIWIQTMPIASSVEYHYDGFFDRSVLSHKFVPFHKSALTCNVVRL